MKTPHGTLGRCPGLDFSIGCVPFRLHSADRQMFRAVSKRYAAFAARQRKPLAIHVEKFSKDQPQDAEFAYELEGCALRTDARKSCFNGVRNEYALDSLLRVLLSWKLLDRQGFLLHAATVIRGGRAYIFTGRSGAGKSTVASMSPAGSVLTDEISLLRRENGVWRAYGTPFWGEFRAAGSNTNAPVTGIFRLVQAAENRVTRLRPSVLLRSLLPNVLFFSGQTEANRQLLEILSKAASEIPGYNLAFRKSPAFWEILPS